MKEQRPDHVGKAVEFAEFLVRHGIDSISLTPDTVVATTGRILELERELGRRPRKAAA